MKTPFEKGEIPQERPLGEGRNEIKPGLQDVPEMDPPKTPTPDVIKGILPEDKIEKLQEKLREDILGKKTPAVPTDPKDKTNRPTLH